MKSVWVASLAPDGKRYVRGLWNVAFTQRWQQRRMSAWAVAISPDGKLLVSASDGKDVKLWSAGSGAPLKTLKGHTGYVNNVTFSPNGRLLSSNSDDNSIKLWDTGSRALLQTIKEIHRVFFLSRRQAAGVCFS
jgi:WD40 repeat protein